MRLSACVLVASVVLAGCEVNLNTEGLSARETLTFNVTGQPEVVLDTFDGVIEIHSWEREEVEVEIERRANEQTLLDEIKVESSHTDGVVRVKVTGPRPTEFRGVTIGVNISPSARLRVALPRNSNVNATSGDGPIRVEGLEGRLVLHTSDGSVTGSRLAGELQVRSGDGAIRLEDVSGRLDLETTDGSIGITGKPSVVKARTGDGPIRATIESDAVMTEDWDLSTSDGTVVVTLPGTFHAEVDAETSDGAVRASHPSIAADDEGGEGRRERRRTLRATMGDGGKVLRLRTGDGTIRIER